MSEWDKNRHVPTEELEGREAFVRENAMALLYQRDERIREQKGALSQCNKARRDIEKKIACLQAEVERLKEGLRRSTDDVVKPTVEKAWRERDEALAQVAALLPSIERAIRWVETYKNVGEPNWYYELRRAIKNIPAEARALLNRLQVLERRDAANDFVADQLEERLQRAEAVVEKANRVVSEAGPYISPSMGAIENLAKALAAWEEGKRDGVGTL